MSPDGSSARIAGVALTEVRGAKDHPFTRGGLCTKKNPYLDDSAHPDR